MDLNHIFEKPCDWLDNSGPMADIVISSRIRLARNINGFRFFNHADHDQQLQLLEFVQAQLRNLPLHDQLLFFAMTDSSPLQRQLLRERQLVSKQFAEASGARAVVLKPDESVSLMINEEDHLRLQTLASGLQLETLYERINKIDDMIEQNIEYAYSPEFGYLTACPTNVGTGIRVSVMLHLPALKLTGQMEKVLHAARDMSLAVRGLYGEGSEPLGDFYQISNQTTLGKSENAIIAELLRDAVEPAVRYERLAREKLYSERRVFIEDKIFRALGVLRQARIIASEEALYMISLVRLGRFLGCVKDVDLDKLQELFLFAQPAHLQLHYGRSLDTAQRDILRADLIRTTLN